MDGSMGTRLCIKCCELLRHHLGLAESLGTRRAGKPRMSCRMLVPYIQLEFQTSQLELPGFGQYLVARRAGRRREAFNKTLHMWSPRFNLKAEA